MSEAARGSGRSRGSSELDGSPSHTEGREATASRPLFVLKSGNFFLSRPCLFYFLIHEDY